jgi:hypothetical protein
MKTVFFIITIVFAIAGCKSSITFPDAGYTYLTKINPEDSNFYLLPLKDSIPSIDSFDLVTGTKEFFDAFNEPNLSLAPLASPIFRFVYESFGEYPVILVLTKNELIVKQAISGMPGTWVNTQKLTRLEQQHLHYYKTYYRWYKPSRYQRSPATPYYKAFPEKYPRLKNIEYYKELLDKASDTGEYKFQYTTRKLPLSNRKFKHLVNEINNSGYWNLPDHPCKASGTDGFGFMFEANGPSRYKVVFIENCQNEPHIDRFIKAITGLLTEAGLKKSLVFSEGESYVPDTIEAIDVPPIPMQETTGVKRFN